jgi:DNA-binding NtrC family response regulator
MQIHADIECAISTGANVVISGGHAASRSVLARFIHERSAAQQGPLVIVNDGDHFAAAVTDAPGSASAGDRTLFIENLTALGGPEQTELMNMLEKAAPRLTETGRKVRLISGMAHDVIEQLASTLFNTRLFYRLNTIHIALAPV